MSILAACALAAPQAPVEIAFEGVVPATGATLVDAPFAGIAPGDPVELHFEVQTPGNLGGTGQFDIYPLVDTTVELTIGTATTTLGSSVSGSGGEFSLALDLTQTPQPSSFVSVLAGETWNFQAWHRDVATGAATSNFTSGLSITFS